MYMFGTLFCVQALQHVFPMRGQMAQEKASACAGSREGDCGRGRAREHEVLGSLATAVQCEQLFEELEAAVNKRAAHLLSRADTALTLSVDGSTAPL